MFPSSSSFRIAFFIGSLLAPTALAVDCKPLPSEPGWPSLDDWKALNESVSGRLVAPVPLGAVCHPDEDVYNNATCTHVQAQWTNASWHGLDPWSANYCDDTCRPNPELPCSADGYPAYVVKAECPQDVMEAVNFANRTGMRLIVKGTGHDFLVRSSGPSALSVWTHLFQGIEVNKDDPRATRYGGIASVKVGAGMRWGEIYAELAKEKVTVIGGSDANVGVSGLIAGGGHSPISAHFGFPADNVLEMEVVTADGKHRIINEESDADLFWAMRGGGGSTFAIIISITLKAYPELPGATWTFSFNTTANSDTLWSLLAYLHSQLPTISEAGGMGYYTAFPNASVLSPESPVNPAQAGQVSGNFIFPEATIEHVNEVMGPFEENVHSAEWATNEIFSAGFPEAFASFMEKWSHPNGQAVGGNNRLGSWLLDEKAVMNFEGVKKQLQKASASISPILGHFVSGSAVRDVDIPGGWNAILPAWRDAYTHIGTCMPNLLLPSPSLSLCDPIRTK